MQTTTPPPLFALVARNGGLYLETLCSSLPLEHGHGDADLTRCPWPMPDPSEAPHARRYLRFALREARADGYLPDTCSRVALPDGSPFVFDHRERDQTTGELVARRRR